jgi:L-fuconolactonase
VIIDTHLHLWDLDRFDYAWISRDNDILHRDYLPEHIAPQLTAAGVSGAVFVQACSDPAESDWVLSLADAHPWLLGVVGWIDLAAPHAAAQIARLARAGRFKGVRFGHVGHDGLLADSLQPGLRALAARGLTLDLLAGGEALDLLPELARLHPDLTFVLDHLGAPPLAGGDLADWRRRMIAIEREPNVAVKVSGLLTQARLPDGRWADIAPAVRHALAVFGPHRLMFGGDWPVSLLAAPYTTTVDATRRVLADLPAADAVQVWQTTARRIYRLDQLSLTPQNA